MQAQDGSLTVAEEGTGPAASWGVNMGSDGSLEIRNKATGNYLQKKLEGEELTVSSEPRGDCSKWDIESDNGAFSSRGLGVTDPSLAAAIGSGLVAAGGAALVQHASQGVCVFIYTFFFFFFFFSLSLFLSFSFLSFNSFFFRTS